MKGYATYRNSKRTINCIAKVNPQTGGFIDFNSEKIGKSVIKDIFNINTFAIPLHPTTSCATRRMKEPTSSLRRIAAGIRLRALITNRPTRTIDVPAKIVSWTEDVVDVIKPNKASVSLSGEDSVERVTSVASLSGENSATPKVSPKNLSSVGDGCVESPRPQVSGSTVTTCTLEDFNDLLRQNINLKKHTEFQISRGKIKLTHIRHGNNEELKDVLRLFHESHKTSLKRYENWKQGLDVVFRHNRAVILKTRKGDDVLVTGSQGIGGYGRVAKGYHMKLNCEKVVIKEYIGFDDRKNRLQYQGEVQNLKDLCSDKYGKPLPYNFIPHYIDRKEEVGSYFLMSAWAGNDITRLHRYHKDYLLGNVGFSLVTILQAIHKKGFLHRDVKPENICIDENDVVRLIDVGSMVRVDKTGHVVTGQPYNDYQHCSLNMHQAYGKRPRCELSIFDDLWMVIFALLRVLRMVPGYWKDQGRRECIIVDKRRIMANPDSFFGGSGTRLEVMKKSICYLRDANGNTFDYDHLAGLLSQL